MSFLGDTLSGIQGLMGAQAKSRDAKLQQAQQQDAYNSQSGIAALLQKLAIAQGTKGTDTSDAFGGGTRYDPATGTWKSSLSAPEMANQSASYGEEGMRLGADQAIRRYGLGQAEQLRQGAAGSADSARRSYDLFNQGVGQVDPNAIASSMALSRQGAVNAGYDDAMHAAGTLSLRTGTSAGDTFSNLARNRANDIARTKGDPYTEALSMAEGINSSRGQTKLNSYNLFNQNGSNFYDAAFQPVDYAAAGRDTAFKSAGLNLDNFNASTNAMGNAAGIISGAAGGARQAGQMYQNNVNYAAPAQFTKGISNSLDDLIKKIGTGG